MRFFTSDLHFGSENTLKFDKRPFENCKAFQKAIIKKWNKIAKSDDIIYVIGDFVDCHSAVNPKCLESLLLAKKVKAKIVLILGNNEERIIKYYFHNDFEKFKKYCLDCGFFDVKKSDIVTIGGTNFYLTHKPKNYSQDMLTLFGHSHKAMGLYKSFGLHIGCDLNNYEPYSEQDIVVLLGKKTEFGTKTKI